MTEPAPSDAKDPAPEAPSVAAPKKQPAESLTLRAAPRRTVRFKRGVIIAAAALGAVTISGLAWLALSPKVFHLVKAADPVTTPQAPTPTDAINNLPGDYSQVTSTTPVLGPPLPGDLGQPFLERERQRALDPDAGSPTLKGQAAQAAETEAEKTAQLAEQARQSAVLVHVASPNLADGAHVDSPSVPISTPAALPPDAVGGAHQGLDQDHDPNDQAHKLDFVSQAPTDTIDNRHALQTLASPYQVLAGTVISASLITGLNSDLPGMVIAQVTENVYDTATGRILLIPQGARLIGVYDSVVAFGQRRALLVWQRLILPDGSSLQIDNLPATDAAGYTGLEDKVDVHTWQLLKGVGLATLLGVGTQVSLDDESDLIRAIRQSAQQAGSQAGQQIVGKALDVQPTLTVRPGWPLRVIVHKDLTLKPWTTTN